MTAAELPRVQEGRLERVLRAIGETPEWPNVVERLCTAALPRLGADGIAIATMVADDLLAPVCATGCARAGEGLQTDLGEGPSYLAHRVGTPVLVPDVEVDGTWPAFARAAADLDLRAVFAFPLRRGAIRLGAFTVYRDRPGDLTSEQHAEALLFARLALDLLLASQSGRPLADLDRLFGEGGATARIHQASGIVAVQLGITIEQALAVLRAHAYAERRTLPDLTAEVVRRDLRFVDEPPAPGDGW